MNPLNTAIELAKESGRVQMDGLGQKHDVDFKGVIDIVTEVDRKCEKLIVSRLQKDFPTHDILAEEGTGKRLKSEWRWIIDPLDGTVNYNHTYPFFCTSIALEHKGNLVLGVVYEPNRDELFVAEKGGGATLNGRKISVSKEDNLKRSLLSTGFAYNVQEGEQRNNLEYFGRFLMETQAMRRDGVAEADLCYLACGRFDGFWELFLKPWDMAAGVVIIREAGGKVTDFGGSEVDIYGTEILATNGHIHSRMIEVLNGTLLCKEGKGEVDIYPSW